MKPRSRAYNRDVSRRKALRKKRISDNFWPHASNYPYYDNLHQYSKNKIHCSSDRGHLKWEENQSLKQI